MTAVGLALALGLAGCGSSASWRGLTKLENLRVHGDGFSDISVLGNLTNLYSMGINNCQNVTDISAVEKLTDLNACYIRKANISEQQKSPL